jgi:glycogen debranching enzyme
MMLSSFGFLTLEDGEIPRSVRTILETLAAHQSPLGQVPSLANDPSDLGASDTTPLFLVGLGLYRRRSGEAGFLQEAAEKALQWMAYQSPDNTLLVSQQPTSDWRDEQWVLGFGLYVNALYYIALRLHDRHEEAERLRHVMAHYDLRSRRMQERIHEGLAIPDKPYLALWAYKMYRNERFDLLGNSLAILSGLVSHDRAGEMIGWVERSSEDMRARGDLQVALPPCLFPYIQHGDQDWYPRLDQFNPPGGYHNGGIWPFINSFYIAALVHSGHHDLAAKQLQALTELVRQGQQTGLVYGFNEWYQAQTGLPRGQDWQTWSAAVYLYALAAVESGHAPFFESGFPFAEEPPAPEEGEERREEKPWEDDLLP